MGKLDTDHARKILQETSPDKAFHFYISLGSPLGVSAGSLGQLVDTIRNITIDSIDFHLYRGDLERWITMLGDETLAHQIATIARSGLKGDQLRRRLVQILQLRYGTLRKLASKSSIK